MDVHNDEFFNCERISLISSFMTTLFIGNYTPIDQSDASGMNMMDIRSKHWSQQVMKAICKNSKTRKHLIKVIGEEPIPSKMIIGFINEYFVDRYGFSKQCKVRIRSCLY